MKRTKQVTPNEAAAVWASLASPSARQVAKKLAKAGRRVHHTTIARWRARGWRPVAQRPHPIDAAREALDVAARALTGDLAADAFAKRAGTSEELGDFDDREILRRAARDLLVSSVVLLRGEFLVQEKIVKTAVFVKTVATATRAASRALCQLHEWPEHGQPGSGVDPSSRTPQRRQPTC
jgi:hypothetical protein